MPDTNDALQSLSIEVPADWQDALGGSQSDEVTTPTETPEQQAEEVKAPETQTEVTEDESTQTDDTTDEPTAFERAFEWADDDERAVFTQHVDGDTLKLDGEVLDLIRQVGMRRRGFHQRMREVSDQAKENESLIRDGEQFRRLFTDPQAQQEFLAWQENKGKATEPADVPEFETNEQLADYVRQEAQRLFEEHTAKLAAERDGRKQQQTEAQALLDRNAENLLAGEFSDLSQEEFVEAIKATGDALRELEVDPSKVCLDESKFARALRPHAERIRLTRKLQAKDKQRELTKRAAERSESASSAPQRRGESDFDLSTPAGRQMALEHQFGGKEITTLRTS